MFFGDAIKLIVPKGAGCIDLYFTPGNAPQAFEWDENSLRFFEKEGVVLFQGWEDFCRALAESYPYSQGCRYQWRFGTAT